MLGIFTIVGLIEKIYKFSRPGMIIGFILADRIEGLTLQISALYTFESLITRPIFLTIVIGALIAFIIGIKSKRKLNYA
jgi:hypothetical protein